METALISYQQTYLGLPVWEAGVAVVLQDKPPRVTSSNSTIRAEIDAKSPPADAPFLPEGITPKTLRPLLGLEGRRGGVKINGTRLLVYRYDALQRFDPELVPADDDDGGKLHFESPSLPLPPVPDGMKDDRHYVVTEVLFTASIRGWGEPINWRCVRRARDGRGAVPPRVRRRGGRRRLSKGSAHQDGRRHDYARLPRGDARRAPRHRHPPGPDDGEPADADGSVRPARGHHRADRGAADVDRQFQLLRADRQLRGGQRLPPLRLAVPAMVRAWASTSPPTSTGPTFPVRVDRRWRSADAVNARAPGQRHAAPARTGSSSVWRARCPAVSIAADVRVVLHEFGHALLWDSVHSPNFGFAHSAGDSLAAILHRPGLRCAPIRSAVPRRSRGSPSTGATTGRQRRAGAGAATNDVGGATARASRSSRRRLFRFYRSIGGDSTNVSPCDARRAARRPI